MYGFFEDLFCTPPATTSITNNAYGGDFAPHRSFLAFWFCLLLFLLNQCHVLCIKATEFQFLSTIKVRIGRRAC